MDDPDDKKAVILPPAAEDALVPLRYRFDGWTAGKQRAFLAGLGDTGCVRDACRMVGMSKTSAYRLRGRSADFTAAWDRALEMAGTVLEHVAFERAVIGIDEPVYRYGKFIGMRRKYSDSLLRLLIQRGDLRGGMGRSRKQLERAAEEAAALAGGYFAARVTREETNRALMKQLRGYRRRAAIDEAAAADRLRAAGKAP